MQDYRTRYGAWALILGGSEGLGKAIASEAARRGMNVAIVARRANILDQAAKDIADEFGVETRAICLDLADLDVIAAIDRGMSGEEVSFMIYNAAAEPHGEFLKLEVQEHRYNIQVNVLGPTLLTHHFGRKMVDRGKGGIVLCSSLAANQGIYSYASYGAAKAYEMILGEGLWDEFRDSGVDVCTLMVGSTYTPNFKKTQIRKRSIFAESRTPANVPPGVSIPQLPEAAAAHLFEQLDGKWRPLIYANASDAERSTALKDFSREELIGRIGAAMRTGYRAEMA
jgi:short-subunit dehydrogenase